MSESAAATELTPEPPTIGDKMTGATEKDSPPRPIERHEIEQIEWYFEKGIGRLERHANSVDLMEAASFYALAARPCRACGGKWQRIAADGTVLQEEQGGTGFITSAKEWREKVKLARLLDCDLDLPGDAECKKCDGRGWVKGGGMRRRRTPPEDRYQWIDGRITVNFTGSSVHGNGAPDTGGDDNLRKLGRLDRLMAQLRRRDPEDYSVLDDRYSPAGKEMKLTALWHRTPAGKTMLRGNSMGLSPRQYFENLSQRQQKRPEANRKLQFDAADRQSEALLLKAQRAWVALLDAEWA